MGERRMRATAVAVTWAGVVAWGIALSAAAPAGAIAAEETVQSTTVAVVCTYLSPSGQTVDLAPVGGDEALAARVDVTAPEEFLTDRNDFFGAPAVTLRYDFIAAIRAAAAGAEPSGEREVVVAEHPVDDDYPGLSLVGGNSGVPPAALEVTSTSVTRTASGGVTAGVAGGDLRFDVGANSLLLANLRIPLDVAAGTRQPETHAAQFAGADAGVVECEPGSGEPALIAGYVIESRAPTTTPPTEPTEPTAPPSHPTAAPAPPDSPGPAAALADTGGGSAVSPIWPASFALLIVGASAVAGAARRGRTGARAQRSGVRRAHSG